MLLIVFLCEYFYKLNYPVCFIVYVVSYVTGQDKLSCKNTCHSVQLSHKQMSTLLRKPQIFVEVFLIFHDKKNILISLFSGNLII